MSSPTVRRHRLGAELRQLREAAGLTGDQVVASVGWGSASKLSRIENGRSRPNLADILDLLDLYGTTGAQRETITAIARDAASTRGWWRSVADLGERQRQCAELEAGAVEIREYHQLVVPGLVQTPEYTRTRVTSALDVYGNLDVGAEVDARQSRQALLADDDPPRYEAVIDEAALRRRVAPAEVMRGQLRRLVEAAGLPNVTLRVLPFDARVADYYVPHTSFLFFRFADPDDPEVVLLETLTSDVQLADEDDIARYRLVFDWLRAAALPPDESIAFLAALADRS
ncbi:MAG: helix-turn-helix domain-containing protein [Streptosporangiaceae bacterium]